MAIETPDLTGFSERERRIFAMGAHWAEGATLQAMVAMLETVPVPPGLSNTEVKIALIGAMRTLGDMSTCLERLQRDGVAR